MQISILGPLEVTVEGRRVDIAAPMQRTVLILLALHANEVLSTDRIVDALWGDEPPSDPRNALRFHVSKVRGSLGNEGARLQTRSTGYVLELEGEDVDARRFEHLAVEGRGMLNADPDEALRLLSEALSLWRGEPLADVAYRSFASREAQRLSELRIGVTEDLLAARIASGSSEPIAHEIRSLLDEHSYRERLWQLLMISLYQEESQAAALEAFNDASRVLAEIGLEPSAEMRQIEGKILLRDPVLSRPERELPGNLPHRANSFIGRETDLEELAALLAEHRVVTITGAGGIGKTSLAVEVARNVSSRFGDGAWMVQLADLTDPELVSTEVATELGITMQPQHDALDVLVHWLRRRSALVVLDNCEHLLSGCVEIVDSLAQECAGVRILTTSRAPLGVDGEVTWALDPLQLAPAEGRGVAPAVELFIDRARETDPRWVPGDDGVAVVSEICARVDGMPLAIEMAAARMRSISPTEILSRLAKPETLRSARRPGSPRHRSMTAALDWSYDLLNPDEQEVFGRLAVFRGSFNLDSVERVLEDREMSIERIDEALDRLVAASMIVRIGGEPTRYRMLEPVRQYSERLGLVSGEVRSRHAEHFCNLAEQADAHMQSSEAAIWAQHLRTEQPNLRAALEWVVASRDADLGLRLARSLNFYWARHGYDREAVDWLLQILDLDPDLPPSLILAESLSMTVFHLLGAVRVDEARPLLDREFEMARALGDVDALARAHGNAGFLEMVIPDSAAAVEHFSEQARLTAGRSEISHLHALSRLAEAYMYIGRTARSVELAEEIRAKAKAAGNDLYAAFADSAEGEAAYYDGDLDRARQMHEAAWDALRMIGPSPSAFFFAEGLAVTVLALGDVPASRAVAAELESILEAFDPDVEQAAMHAWMGIIRSRLALLEGHARQSIRELAASLHWLEFEPHVPSILIVVDDLARALADVGSFVAAAELIGAADDLREELRIARPTPEQGAVAQTIQRLREEMGQEELGDAWIRPSELTVDTVAERASTHAAEFLGG